MVAPRALEDAGQHRGAEREARVGAGALVHASV